jgi:hypothetical protein
MFDTYSVLLFILFTFKLSLLYTYI